MKAVGILRTGAYVPPTEVGNDRIAQWAHTTPEWIHERTGVATRRYADDTATTAGLAHAAALDLLGPDRAHWPRIGGIIVATSTGDQPQPATAATLQHELGLGGIPAFDVNSVCVGYLFALTVAAGLCERGGDRDGPLLVAATDIYSRIMNRTDRTTVSLFGDGAGATLVGPVPAGYGLHASRLVTDGELRALVEVPATDRLFRMDGRAVRDYVLTTLPKIIDEALGESGLTLADMDRIILHQANTRLLEACVRELGVDPARVPLTAPRYGNTGAASIPLTLHASHLERPLQRGERLLLAGVGGGMSAGAVVLTWY
ncbi:ketoacyl-ACP synthase III [Nocardia sp. 2]|uniref:Ketoacyl-ACP synthase III n=1 Tax=Nocardia acididurans TaxID=2802282 RepID=A0ABS1MB75_9NOCA|nr:ketoacyl-ACP synthase III [Nocardia acididurans]MBL1077526.1 ketoacyl-ACP synthase III [Nocardia acididurans]